MKSRFQFILVLILLVSRFSLMGQDLPVFKFSDYLQNIPKPAASCDETIHLWNNYSSTENEFTAKITAFSGTVSKYSGIVRENYGLIFMCSFFCIITDNP